ncbi:hypothetical protein C8R43DRAFT_1142706 [Mycena crocata]|nr:hypothetical protein C8R43DRAFT_1142706 [Mycena crocata]
MRYHPTFVKYCTLMRSYGPRSGAQYNLLSEMTGMTGAISQRQTRRRAAKSSTRMTSSELCAAPVPRSRICRIDKSFRAVDLCGYGTKLRHLLTTSTELCEKGSAHVVGLTFPLGDVLFKSSEEQSEIISNIDSAEAIATQVWVMAIQIPLPGMPVFPVAFIPKKGKILGGEAGIKLLATSADGPRLMHND